MQSGTKILSAGSGVFVSTAGSVLTAQHVVASRGRLIPGTILVILPGLAPRPYIVASPVGIGIDVGVPDVIRQLPIDLAILKPVTPWLAEDCLRLRDDIPPAGTDVLLAGFPDDILLPFMFDEAFELMNPDVNTLNDHLQEHFHHFIRPLMCIDTMIGAAAGVNLSLPGGTIEAATYSTPIGFTYGGSGGPMVDLEGSLVGIAIRKGVTDARRLHIQGQGGFVRHLPTATGYALSHKLITRLPGMCAL